MSVDTDGQRTDVQLSPVFQRVLCGVNGSRASFAAAAQAAVLAGPEAELELLAIAPVAGFGPTEMSELAPKRAQDALDRARALARDAGVTANTTLLHAADVTETLLEVAAGRDLVAVGARGSSRLAEIFLGGRATALVHRAVTPVLVARPLGREASFPGTILVASDASEGSARAVELAAQVAARHEARVVHLHVRADGSELPAEREALARETARIAELTRSKPVVLAETGHAADVICEVAARVEPGLLVVGSRGRAGVKALGSVSEAVAHRARCSVLVVRPPA